MAGLNIFNLIPPARLSMAYSSNLYKKVLKMLVNFGEYYNFGLHIVCRGPMWVERAGAIGIMKAFTDALSWQLETRTISISVRNEATVDGLWICIFWPQGDAWAFLWNRYIFA